MSPDVEDALKRGGVVWVSLDGAPPRAVWHVWRDGAVHVVAGGEEQELPGRESATTATVVVRNRGALSPRAAELPARVERLAPGTPEWEAVVALLAPERLHAPDPEALPGRWAAGSTVLRLVPD